MNETAEWHTGHWYMVDGNGVKKYMGLQTNFCSNCGKDSLNATPFCGYCGRRMINCEIKKM